MKEPITFNHVNAWLLKRANDLDPNNENNSSAFRLGMLMQILAGVLNDPKERQRLMKEIAEANR